VSLARIIKWDVDPTGALDRSLSPDQIMDRLEKRVGPGLSARFKLLPRL
jgi:hypothetical protein